MIRATRFIKKEFKIVTHGLKEHQAGSIKKVLSPQYQTKIESKKMDIVLS